MDESKKEALRQCHPNLREDITVADILPSLRIHVSVKGLLNDAEYDSIRKKQEDQQFDELMDILLTKENKDFDYFCTVLEKEGYTLWSEKLKEVAGLGKRQQLSCTYGNGAHCFCQTSARFSNSLSMNPPLAC